MADRHVLVVGGTGMLRGVSLELARRGCTVSVVARRRERLAAVERAAGEGPGRIHPICLDYRDTAALTAALDAATERHGPIGLAVVWIHSTAPEAPLAVARAIAVPDRPADYFHVLGSASADPSRPNPERRARFAAVPGIRYHEVVLGFVYLGHGSRWLTDDEISRGVLTAVDQGAERFIVGTVEPWSARP